MESVINVEMDVNDITQFCLIETSEYPNGYVRLRKMDQPSVDLVTRQLTFVLSNDIV